MFTVGLTGGIGSGKTTVADAFAALGVTVVDADLLSRQAVLPGSEALQAIAQHFGAAVINEDGALDRAALREIVFHAPEQRAWLEALLHPIIRDLMHEQLAACSGPYCLLVSPLLLETTQQELVDRRLVIDVPVQTQVTRAMQRDGSDESIIRGIIAAQTSRESRLAAADDVFDNDQSISSIAGRVRELHEKYLKMAEAYE